MYIKGFAYQPDEADVHNSRIERLRELTEIGFNKIVESFSVNVLPTKTEYNGRLSQTAPKLTEEDLLVLLDGSPVACFGGSCSISSDGSFQATVYTD